MAKAPRKEIKENAEVKKDPKKRDEIPDDLFEELKGDNSRPARIEFLLVAILRELKRLK